MSYTFPAGFYGDVRIEDVAESSIQVTLGEVEEMKERSYRAAFVRVYDGSMWYYASTTDIEAIQSEIDRLTTLGTPSPSIDEDPIVARFEVNSGDHCTFTGAADISSVTMGEKQGLLASYGTVFEAREYVGMWRANYVDQHKVKHFTSSKGADLSFDTQQVGFRVSFELADGDRRCREMYELAGDAFAPLAGHQDATLAR